jgi:O-antigen/teichoic acid export membrane protein
MVLRDQIAHLLVARGRLRQLSSVTFAAAIVSLAVIYEATLHLGAFGALVGVFLGEFLNLLGVIALSVREAAPIKSPFDEVK